MNLISILILALTAVGFVMAVRYCVRNGISCGECSKCSGCSGTCSAAAGRGSAKGCDIPGACSAAAGRGSAEGRGESETCGSAAGCYGCPILKMKDEFGKQ